ncbi:hypothetical protein [Saccharothrix deserti]|uniref:hypothetical protein n=1 Tax=Saccharothrix deserti TaxID=2593674 RepID=UPI00131C7D98|nr:hypothetical protein [Saccharothrix deserti]
MWITVGQWAGKSTAARTLAVQYGLTAHHHDYHDARGHLARRIANDGSQDAEAVADDVATHFNLTT